MVIPNGVEKIKKYWLCYSDIESVVIPASVREIEQLAFYQCRRLRRVTFADGSQLQKIGRYGFSEAGIEDITIPSSVVRLESSAFSCCGNLKRVLFQDNSQLKRVEGLCFYGCDPQLRKN